MASARKLIDIPIALKILELVETSHHVMNDFFKMDPTAWETRDTPVSQFVSPLMKKELAESGLSALKAEFKSMGINADADIFLWNPARQKESLESSSKKLSLMMVKWMSSQYIS